MCVACCAAPFTLRFSRSPHCISVPEPSPSLPPKHPLSASDLPSSAPPHPSLPLGLRTHNRRADRLVQRALPRIPPLDPHAAPRRAAPARRRADTPGHGRRRLRRLAGSSLGRERERVEVVVVRLAAVRLLKPVSSHYLVFLGYGLVGHCRWRGVGGLELGNLGGRQHEW